MHVFESWRKYKLQIFAAQEEKRRHFHQEKVFSDEIGGKNRQISSENSLNSAKTIKIFTEIFENNIWRPPKTGIKNRFM